MATNTMFGSVPRLSTDASGNTVLVGGDGIGKSIRQPGAVATRIPFGRMTTLSNATAKTFHITAEAACHFDAVRPIFASIDAARSYQFAVVKASVLSSLATDADLLNSAGTWSSVQMTGQNPIPIKVSIGGSTASRIAYVLPDWLQLSSIARTDGGTYPLVAFRAYCNDTTATALPCYGKSTATADDFTNWETKSGGGMWASRWFSGDGVSTPANFTGGTSATPQSQSPIIGFQYLARQRAVTVCGVGDSMMEGRGTYIGDSYVRQACKEIQAANSSIAVEFMNAGFSGQVLNGASGGINGFAGRALDIINTPGLVPDVIVMPLGSPNDETTTLTAGGVAGQQSAVQEVIAACREKSVHLILVTWIPTNYAVCPRGSTDALRSAYNAAAKLAYPNVCDLAAIHDGGLDGDSQTIMLYTTDGIHQNDAGNALDAAAIRPFIENGIGRI